MNEILIYSIAFILANSSINPVPNEKSRIIKDTEKYS